MISEVKQYGERWRVSDTYSGARGSGGAGFAIFAGKTLRGSKINEMKQEGTKKKGWYVECQTSIDISKILSVIGAEQQVKCDSE